jgi:hypothetical protein
VTTPASDLERLATLTREMYDGAVSAHAAFRHGRTLSERLGGLSGADAAAFKARVDSLAPPPIAGARGRFFRRRPSGPPTLAGARDALLDAAMAMQSADVAPTTTQLAACDRARVEAAEVMSRWNRLATTDLDAFNARRRAAGQPTVELPR